jgi:hypothetical protein
MGRGVGHEGEDLALVISAALLDIVHGSHPISAPGFKPSGYGFSDVAAFRLIEIKPPREPVIRLTTFKAEKGRAAVASVRNGIVTYARGSSPLLPPLSWRGRERGPAPQMKHLTTNQGGHHGRSSSIHLHATQ